MSIRISGFVTRRMLRVVQDVSDRTSRTGVSPEKDRHTGNHENRNTNFKHQHKNLFRGDETNI
jgi:hypothetical protein